MGYEEVMMRMKDTMDRNAFEGTYYLYAQGVMGKLLQRKFGRVVAKRALYFYEGILREARVVWRQYIYDASKGLEREGPDRVLWTKETFGKVIELGIVIWV
jgi:hypothetical protein